MARQNRSTARANVQIENLAEIVDQCTNVRKYIGGPMRSFYEDVARETIGELQQVTPRDEGELVDAYTGPVMRADVNIPGVATITNLVRHGRYVDLGWTSGGGSGPFIKGKKFLKAAVKREQTKLPGRLSRLASDVERAWR